MSEHINTQHQSTEQIIKDLEASLDSFHASQELLSAVKAGIDDTVASISDDIASGAFVVNTIDRPDRIVVNIDDLPEPQTIAVDTPTNVDLTNPEERLAKLYNLVAEQPAEKKIIVHTDDVEAMELFDSVDSMMDYVHTLAREYKHDHQFINALRSDEDFISFVDDIKAKAVEEAAGNQSTLAETLELIDREIDDIFMSLVDEPTDTEVVELANTATAEELESLRVKTEANEIFKRPEIEKLLDDYEYNAAYNVVQKYKNQPRDADFKTLQTVYHDIVKNLRTEKVDEAVILEVHTRFTNAIRNAIDGYQDNPEDAFAYVNQKEAEKAAEAAHSVTTNSPDADAANDQEAITEAVTLESWLKDLNTLAIKFVDDEAMLLQIFGDGTSSQSYRKLLHVIDLYATHESNGDRDRYIELYNGAVEEIDALQVSLLRRHGYFQTPTAVILTPIIPTASRDRNVTVAAQHLPAAANVVTTPQLSFNEQLNVQKTSIDGAVEDLKRDGKTNREITAQLVRWFGQERSQYDAVHGEDAYSKTPRGRAYIASVVDMVAEKHNPNTDKKRYKNVLSKVLEVMRNS